MSGFCRSFFMDIQTWDHRIIHIADPCAEKEPLDAAVPCGAVGTIDAVDGELHPVTGGQQGIQRSGGRSILKIGP